MAGEKGFRVELDPVEREGAVLEAHDDAVFAPGGDFQVRGVGRRHEGMIAGRPEGGRQTFEDAPPRMKNLVALAVHRDGGLDGGAPKDFVQGLVSQANPQDGDLPIEMGDDCLADARLLRGLGARRDAEPVRA